MVDHIADETQTRLETRVFSGKDLKRGQSMAEVTHVQNSWSVEKLQLLTITFVLPLYLSWGCPRGIMVKAMDCGIVVSKFVLQSRYYVHLQANTLGKVWTPLSSQQWVIQYHYCSSWRIALALNNRQRLICH